MIQRRAFLATAAASATFAARLRRAYGAPVSIPGVPVDAIANIERLRIQAVAGMAAGRGRIAAAVNPSSQALDAGETLIRSVRLHINEARMHDLLNYLAYDADAIYTLAATAPQQPGMPELALRCAMARKGRFTREQFFAQSIWMRKDAAQQPALVAVLQAARRRFTQAVEAESANDMEAAAGQIVSIQDQLNMSRQHLLNVPIPSPDDLVLDMGVDNLVSDVDFGEILLVYVEYNSLPQLGGTGSSAYLGIIAQAGTPVVILPLGAANAIELAAATFAAQAADPSSNPATAAQSLHTLIFAPLTSHFVSSQFTTGTLLVSPDGSLFQVPFAALQDQSGTMLFDSHPIEILDSPLQASLIGGRTNSKNAINLVAFANPALPTTAIASGILPLQEAEHETTDIAALWPSGDAQVFTGPAATPDQLIRQAPNAGILHIACHGQLAYSPVSPYAASPTSELTPTAQPVNTTDKKLIAPSMVDAALARSVLVLAPTSDDSGYFSALEVSGLVLSRTQLVCLSACDTGKGDYARGEGIYGLRSAFLAAGAESVVSVLWEADDAVTETLMVTYYRLMFQGNKRADALRNAMALIRQTNPHPAYWAGFVFSGVNSLLNLPPDDLSHW